MPQFDKWDDNKNRINRIKHKISFEQAKTIWQRPLAIEFDERHSDDEIRFKATGLLPNLTCIVVIYVERDRKIRIISARKAEPEERQIYYEHYGDNANTR